MISFTVEVDGIRFTLAKDSFRCTAADTLMTMTRAEWLMVVAAFAAAFRDEILTRSQNETT